MLWHILLIEKLRRNAVTEIQDTLHCRRNDVSFVWNILCLNEKTSYYTLTARRVKITESYFCPRYRLIEIVGLILFPNSRHSCENTEKWINRLVLPRKSWPMGFSRYSPLAFLPLSRVASRSHAVNWLSSTSNQLLGGQFDKNMIKRRFCNAYRRCSKSVACIDKVIYARIGPYMQIAY